VDVLVSYCETYEEVRELTEEVRKAPRVIEYGKGNKKIHPNVTLLRDAQKHLLLLSRELGLTPSARSRVRVDGTAPLRDELLV